jgi:hypothetical protein
MEDNFGVSLVKYICPICGDVAEEGIIMNSILTEEYAKEVKELHRKAVGYADKCCKECSKYKDDVVFFIGIDASKSDKEPYRTGQIIGIKKESPIVKEVKDFILKLGDGTQYVFIAEEVGTQMGLWRN